MILNLVILVKKNPPPVKSTSVQAEKTIINPDVNTGTKSASDTAKLAEELTAIHNELSQIRAIQRGQSQTLGTSETDIEDFLGDINAPTATPTAKLTPRINSSFVKEVN